MISTHTTLIYGEAESGKSSLASLLVASLVTGKPFLDRVPSRTFRVAVCWTDDDGAREYKSRIRDLLPDDAVPEVYFFNLPVMKDHEHWEALYQSVVESQCDFVIIDNHSQAINGPLNNDAPHREFFGGARLFTRAGVPVVVVTHSSDKAYEGHKSNKPIGHSYITQAVRWRCFISRRASTMTLRFAGNHARPHEVKLTQTGHMEFELEWAKSADQLVSESNDRSRKRDSARMDENAKMAQWVVDHCQEVGVNAAAKMLSKEFGKAESTMKQNLSTRALSKMLTRTGEGSGTLWERL